MTETLQINPNHAHAWNNKGVALRNLRKYSEAIQSYDKAIEIDANNAYALRGKGVSSR